ncbi:MAG: hypothetical protein ACKV0T_04965 [Planctomycetales bacterium]
MRFSAAQFALLLLLMGCSPFNMRAAQEVSRDRLLALAEKDRNDHLKYIGTEGGFHYVVDSRYGGGRTFKIRAEQLPLKDQFTVGEDSYTLWPEVIEGKLLGSRPDTTGL